MAKDVRKPWQLCGSGQHHTPPATGPAIGSSHSAAVGLLFLAVRGPFFLTSPGSESLVSTFQRMKFSRGIATFLPRLR